MTTAGETIGVKLAFDGQMRRFPLAKGTSFKSLHDQVIALLGLEKDADIVLKYTDEEGDNVTIASDLELNSALVPDQLLRLVVTLKNPVPHPVAPQVFTHPQLEQVDEFVQVPPVPLEAGGMFRAFGHGMGARGPAPWERHPPHFGPHGGFPHPPPFAAEDGDSHPPHHDHHGRGGHGPHGRGGHGSHGRGGHGPHGRGGFHPHPHFGRGGFGPHFARGGHHGPHGHPGDWFGPFGADDKMARKWQKKMEKCQEKSHKRAHKMEKMEKRDRDDRLVARFAKDVTIVDGTQLAPNTSFVKTWRVRNEGPEWPAGCVLRYLSKHSDKLGSPEFVALPLEGPVPNNTEVDISVKLVAPEKPGRYTGYWKMCTPEGRKFGQRVWASIVVPADSSSSSSSSSSESDREADKIEELVDAMLAMGFDAKRHKIFRLLKKNKGDVEKVSRKLEKCQKKKAKKCKE